MRESRRAPKRARVRPETARRERARAYCGLAREHHSLRAQRRAARAAFRGEVTEDRTPDSPAAAPSLVGGERLEVALEEREQRLVGGRVERVVEEESRRVLVARLCPAESFPEKLTVFARVLRAHENLARAEVNSVHPFAPREPARDCADRRAHVRRPKAARELPRDLRVRARGVHEETRREESARASRPFRFDADARRLDVRAHEAQPVHNRTALLPLQSL